MLELTDSLKTLLQETAEGLNGHERRFMAQTVDELGPGERELGWNRGLIRKGKRELDSGIVCVDAFKLRGRQLSEERLPNSKPNRSQIQDQSVVH